MIFIKINISSRVTDLNRNSSHNILYFVSCFDNNISNARL